jgi:integrase/recombinase XerD
MKHSFLFKRGKYYQLQYFDEIEGKKKRISTGESKKSEALLFVSRFQESKEKQKPLNYISLAEFSQRYKDYLSANFSKKYLSNVSNHLKRFSENMGNKALIDIRMNDVELFLTGIAGESKVKSKKYYVSLNSMFNKAVQWDYISINPAAKIIPPRIPKNNPLFIDEAELQQIIEKESNPNLKDIYLVLFHTGMRLGELLNLKWNQVSFTDKIIKLTNSEDFTTKGKKERTIPINDNLIKIFTNRYPKVIDIHQLNYVFNKKGFKYSGDYISKSFKRIVNNSENINHDIHLHSLRHSFATFLVKKGVSLFIVKELLGHQDYKTTLIYSHLTTDNLRDAVKVLEG